MKKYKTPKKMSRQAFVGTSLLRDIAGGIQVPPSFLCFQSEYDGQIHLRISLFGKLIADIGVFAFDNLIIFQSCFLTEQADDFAIQILLAQSA